MGFFDKFKGKKETVNWNDAYEANPKFYGKPDGSPFGAIALTEGTKTILPKNPQSEYLVDGKAVSEWKLMLISTSKDAIIGDTDYFVALKKIERYSLDTTKNAILIKELSLAELEGLME